MRRATASEWRIAAIGLLAAVVTACSGPTAQDKAMAQLFWVAPSALAVRTEVPTGLGIERAPQLVMTLANAPGSASRSRSFTLAPAGSGAWTLKPGDYRPFLDMQERVVASIGSQASVSVALQVAYCATAGTMAGRGSPVAELHDRTSGRLIMSAPPQAAARDLFATLPPCG